MKSKPLACGLPQVEKLCLWPEPYQKPENYEVLFTEAFREILLWHQTKSSFYRQFLKNSNFDPKSWKGELTEVPFLVADFFKQHEIKSISDQEVSLHLTSSGTTGQKSQIFFDPWSIGCAQQMVDFIFRYYHWEETNPANYLLYSYEPEEGSKLGTAFTDHFLTKYAPIKRVECALRWNGKNGHDFDLYGSIRALQDFASEGLPVRIFGFPAFFYFTLKRMQDLDLPALNLHQDSLVFLGGGWKGHADQAIDKQSFYRLAEKMLGIPGSRLRDGFGSVEHCIPYIECAKHHFHVPVWSKVIIRDLRNLKPLGYDQPGFLHFLSPYITSVPAHSVMMGDLATLHSGKDCGCGLTSDWFEILGRAGVSKNKSCAVAASELLKGFT